MINENVILLHDDQKLVVGEKLDFCPSCHSSSTTVIGMLPKAMHFCAFEYSHAVNNSNLNKCEDCGLWYRNPCLSPHALEKLYSQQPESTWKVESKDQRVDFELIVSSVENHYEERNHASLLDIGCFNGALIDFLRSRESDVLSNFKYYGIEPSSEAAEICKKNNINIIGSSFADISRHDASFSIITMINVFEHIHDSYSMVKKISDKLDENGLLIIVSGATDSDSFSRIKNKYYYPSMPEHVAFISKKHAKWLGEQCLMDVVEYKLFDRRSSIPSVLISFMHNAIFSLLNIFPDKLFHIKNSIWIRKMAKYRSKGISLSTPNADHVVVTFKKH